MLATGSSSGLRGCVLRLDGKPEFFLELLEFSDSFAGLFCTPFPFALILRELASFVSVYCSSAEPAKGG